MIFPSTAALGVSINMAMAEKSVGVVVDFIYFCSLLLLHTRLCDRSGYKL